MEKERKRQNDKSLGIYIHIPFCVKKCDYCDFLSMAAGWEVQEQYCRCLLEEIKLAGVKYRNQGYVADTIFIGGGTPSILKPRWIEKILQAVCDSFAVKGHGNESEIDADRQKPFCGRQNGNLEVTIECNPGTLNEEKLQAYQKAGINRISLGLQSADNRELQLLGRIHTWEQFLESAGLVKTYFSNWNVDLMSALPGQSVESYCTTLDRVLALEPAHISAYSLIIEEGTPFYERYEEDERIRQQGDMPELLPDEEAERKMYEMTGRILKMRGYDRYEISNYAKPGYECRHNDRYWKREDYLGIGLGAASCMNEVRFSNTPDMKEYLQFWQNKNRKVEKQTSDMFLRKDIRQLSVKEQMEETMFLGLRRTEGVDMDLFQRKFKRSLREVFASVLPNLEMQELLQYSGKYIQLTQKGIDVSNYVLAQFLLD